MKRLLFLALAGAVMLTGCENKGKTQRVGDVESDTDTVAMPEEVIVDTTIYGQCGVNTAMHTLELISERGDTMTFAYENDAQGGLNVGDKLAVIASHDKDEPVATRIINITSMMGKWSDLQRSIELNEDGSVVSNVSEPRPYVSWSICNGKLVLSSDTFDVEQIGPDSLYLRNKRGTIGLRRR